MFNRESDCVGVGSGAVIGPEGVFLFGSSPMITSRDH